MLRRTSHAKDPRDIGHVEQDPTDPTQVGSGGISGTKNTKVYIIRMDFLTVELRAQDQSFSITYY